jgi:hypothetical protein
MHQLARAAIMALSYGGLSSPEFPIAAILYLTHERNLKFHN